MTDHTAEYPEPGVIDFQKKRDVPHDTEGHIGYRCSQCAQQSRGGVRVTEHGIDYWQNKQIAWQEECDTIMHNHNNAITEHLPEHKPVDCTECPQQPDLPKKPEPATERALTQG